MFDSKDTILSQQIAEQVALILAERPCVPLVWLSPDEAAGYLRMSARTLEDMRGRGVGPRFEKQGRLVRYRVAEIDTWMQRGNVS